MELSAILMFLGAFLAFLWKRKVSAAVATWAAYAMFAGISITAIATKSAEKTVIEFVKLNEKPVVIIDSISLVEEINDKRYYNFYTPCENGSKLERIPAETAIILEVKGNTSMVREYAEKLSYEYPNLHKLLEFKPLKKTKSGYSRYEYKFTVPKGTVRKA